jgi:hypothetical protein
MTADFVVSQVILSAIKYEHNTVNIKRVTNVDSQADCSFDSGRPLLIPKIKVMLLKFYMHLFTSVSTLTTTTYLQTRSDFVK